MQGIITLIYAEWDGERLLWHWTVVCDDEIYEKGIEKTRVEAVDRVAELLQVYHG